MVEVGLKGQCKTLVTKDNTARAFCSGALEVFATPAMISLMEETCWKMVQPYLEEGQGTVGTRLEIDHSAPSPVGMEITCDAILTDIQGRKLTFSVTASDEQGTIGSGIHERFIINNEKFQSKANSKKEK